MKRRTRLVAGARTVLGLAVHWLSVALACLGHGSARAAEPKVDFASQVQPLLANHCAKCHAGQRPEGGLRLDGPAGLQQGGDSGPLVIAGSAESSRLVHAISGGGSDVARMPPEGKGEPLSSDEIALVRLWIQQGATLPDPTRTIETSVHWAFRRPARAALPQLDSPRTVRNPVDPFIQAKLAEHGLAASAEADRATLMRRLSLDLLGLPPSIEESRAFVADDRPDAYECLVDRALASPFFGERWGRHWLDVARYADSNGYTRDFGRDIWRYRDWVLDAFNADMPFDQFTVEQIAGDMLPGATQDQKIATGFHRNTLVNEEGGTDAEQFRVDAVADRVATTGSAFLGLTVECARCHAHKYDPISQREYYQLFALLNNADEPKMDAPYDWQVASGLLDQRAAIRAQIAEKEKLIEAMRAELEARQVEWERTITPEQRMKLPGPVQESLMISLDRRNPMQKMLAEDLYRVAPEARQAIPLLDEVQRLRDSEPKIPTTLVMVERAEPRVTHIHRRGNFLDLGARVGPAVPAVFPQLTSAAAGPNRLDFARWLVADENPLTPRVIANRCWQHFMGRGIVETENDFGTQGSPPSHPELLDWLALELPRQRWSTKQLLRLIVSSAAYRQSSTATPATRQADPTNHWWSRQSRLRLDAEIVRDASLETAGLLTHRMGGASVFPPQPEGVFDFTQDPKPWNAAQGSDRFRRGMYTHFWRSSPYPALMVFDAPGGNVTCTRRMRSNTPLQSLTLANDAQFLECARALARRVLQQAPADTNAQAEFAFESALARRASAEEHARLLDLIRQQQDAFASRPAEARQLLAELPVAGATPPTPAGSGTPAASDAGAVTPRETELAAWTAVARVLLNLDEFITRE